MHTVLLKIVCKPGLKPTLLDALRGALPDTRAYDGCSSVEVYSDQDEADAVVLWEKWASREHYGRYFQWRVDTGLMDALGPLLAAPPQFMHLDGHGDI